MRAAIRKLLERVIQASGEERRTGPNHPSLINKKAAPVKTETRLHVVLIRVGVIFCVARCMRATLVFVSYGVTWGAARTVTHLPPRASL